MCSHAQNQIRPDLQVQNQKKQYLRVQNKIYTGKKNKKLEFHMCSHVYFFLQTHDKIVLCVCVVKQCFREKRW